MAHQFRFGIKEEFFLARARSRTALLNGSSADTQIAIYEAALERGAKNSEALCDVVDWLARETAGAAVQQSYQGCYGKPRFGREPRRRSNFLLTAGNDCGF